MSNKNFVLVFEKKNDAEDIGQEFYLFQKCGFFKIDVYILVKRVLKKI
jgi:hypothetical protein